MNINAKKLHKQKTEPSFVCELINQIGGTVEGERTNKETTITFRWKEIPLKSTVSNSRPKEKRAVFVRDFFRGVTLLPAMEQQPEHIKAEWAALRKAALTAI